MLDLHLRNARPLILVSLLLTTASCTLITKGRIEDPIDCSGLPDGTTCGNQFFDGIARACQASVCVEVGCADGGTDCASVDTVITSQPGDPSGPEVTFQFEGSDPSATFECRLDDASFTSCVSPLALPGLASGVHVFRVRARVGSTVDASPASFMWTVNADLLDTSITSGPGLISGKNVSFSFTGNKAISFECRLSPAESAYTPCTSPQMYTNLTESGIRTFSVRALGDGGAIDDTPAEQSFTVDTTGPGVMVAGTPAAVATTNSTSAALTFTPVPMNEPQATFLCRFNTEMTFSDCTAGFNKTRLLTGVQVVRVKAVDRFGNEGSELVYTWTVGYLETTIFAIRTTPIAEGTRVHIEGAGASIVRMTAFGPDRFWAQETDGSTSPDNKGITVSPTTYNNAGWGSGVQLSVIGTVLNVDTNLTLVDAVITLKSGPNVIPLSARYTQSDVSMLHREENEGLFLQTAGKYFTNAGTCLFGSEWIETCNNPSVAPVCPVVVSDDEPQDNQYHNFEGILEGTSLGYRYRVTYAQETSDACL